MGKGCAGHVWLQCSRLFGDHGPHDAADGGAPEPLAAGSAPDRVAVAAAIYRADEEHRRRQERRGDSRRAKGWQLA